MSYQDIKVLKGMDLLLNTPVSFILTTHSLATLVSYIKRYKDELLQANKSIKKTEQLIVVSNEVQQLSDMLMSVNDFILNPNNQSYNEGNNFKVLVRLINGFWDAEEKYWKTYNTVACGYSLNEKHYSIGESYTAPVSENAKGEVDREEVKGLDAEEREAFNLDGLYVTSSEELTQEDKEEDEREEEIAQLEEAKKLEQEELKRREETWYEEVGFDYEDNKELDKLREEYMNAEESQLVHILNKANDLVDRLDDELDDEEE